MTDTITAPAPITDVERDRAERFRAHGLARFARKANAPRTPLALRDGYEFSAWMNLTDDDRLAVIARVFDRQRAEAHIASGSQRPADDPDVQNAAATVHARRNAARDVLARVVVACAGLCGSWLAAKTTYQPVARYCSSCATARRDYRPSS